jgi:DUF4097 and DUF4098 domain-containing protein YvlB
MNPFLFRRIRGPIFILCFAFTAILSQWGVLDYWQSWPIYIIVGGILRIVEALLTVGLGFAGWNQQVLPGVPVQQLRRPSFAFGIAEMLIGIVALLVTTGVVDRTVFWHGYATLWPVLLIALGLLLLVERLFEQRLGRNVVVPGVFPRRRRHGGLVFLVLLLIVLGLVSRHGPMSARYLSEDGWRWGQDWNVNWGGETHTNDVSLEQPLGANAVLTVDNARGDVQIAPSTDSLIHVQAHEVAHLRSAETMQAFADVKPVLAINGESATLTVPSRNGVEVNLVLSVPAAVLATVRTHHGDVTLSGLTRAAQINAEHGDVLLNDMNGTVQLTMDHGDVHARQLGADFTITGRADDVTISGVKGKVRLDGDFIGDTSIENVDGPVEFASNRTQFTAQKMSGDLSLDSDNLSMQGVSGGLKLKTRSKDIDLTGLSGNAEITDSNSDVHITAAQPLGTVTVNNDTGDISLSIPDGAAFSLRGQTGSDDSIDSQIALLQATSGGTKTIQGQVGAGGPHIELVTRHGDLTLTKTSADADKPERPDKPEKSAHLRHLQTDIDPPSPVVQ